MVWIESLQGIEYYVSGCMMVNVGLSTKNMFAKMCQSQFWVVKTDL